MKNNKITLFALAGVFLANNAATAQNYTWNTNGNGSWTDNANWLPNTGSPNATASVADLSALNITTNSTISLNGAITVGQFSIGDTNNTHSYTVQNGSGGSLTFNNSGSNATLTQISTSKGDTISANMTLGTNLNVTNLSANRLTLSGPIALNGKNLSIAAGSGNIASGGTYLSALSGSGTIVQNSGYLRLNNAAPSTISFTVNAGTLSIASSSVPSGNIALGSTGALDYQSGGNATYNGIISGAGSVRKSAFNGTFTLSANNTYSGGTTVDIGALNVTSAGSLASGSAFTLGGSATANLANAGQTLGAVSNANGATSALNFSAATGTVTLASLSGAGNTRFGSNAVVTGGISTGTINAVGSLTANITGGTVGAGSLTAGTVSSGTNNITGAAGITTLSGGTTTVGGVATIGTMSAGTANLNGATSSIATLNGGNITLGSSTVLTINDGTSSGVISGGGSLTKASAGTLTLSANNTYSGGTTVDAGALNVTSAGSLASGSAFTLGGSATANLANAGQTLGAVSNANGVTSALNFSAATGTVTLASLSGAGNTRFGSNAVVTGGISTGTVNAIGSLTANITGGTVGAGSLTAGTVSGGTNNITGAAGITTLSGGTTTVGGVATIGTMSAGTANLNGATSSIATLSGGNITLGSSTVLSVSGGSSSGVISGGGGLNKTGAGALELLGVNSYTGTTTVSEGTLSVNGSLAGGVTVNLGATLGGNGTIAGATTVNGELKPGNSPGLLTFSNSLTLGSNATTTMEITGANSSGTRGTTYDAINVGSGLTYGGTLSLNFDTLFTQNGIYTFNLFDSATTSGSFTTMSLAGIYSGSFTNTSNSSILSITQGDNTWSFNQGDGVLTFTVVPEPNVVMVAGSLALMALLRRRRD